MASTTLRTLRTTGLLAILLLLVTSLFCQTLAAPFVDAAASFVGGSEPVNRENSISVRKTSESAPSCTPGSELQDVCERCAKVTKSVLAYPFCCRRRDNVHKWCAKFLAYTFDNK